MAKVLMKGNEAIAQAAIDAGCRFFFGYPITPQNQIPEYMSKQMPKIGGCFLQAESEISAINMVYGAASAGARVMTSSSSPGISLKQEGISYLVGAELPCVIVNIVRGGPGLGSIQAAQSDYFQATRGGGHGDYRIPTLAPQGVQEAVELMMQAFDLADAYRTPVMLLGDGMLGQMMEPVEFPAYKPSIDLPEKDWAATGWDGQSRDRAVINSLYIAPEVLEKHNLKLSKRYEEITRKHTMVECVQTDDAQIVVTAYGTMARIASSAVVQLRKQGMRVGLIRPISLWPFPHAAFERAAAQACTKAFVAIEMSAGQMVEDVRLAVNGQKPVSFYGRAGGMVPTVKEVIAEIIKIKEAL